MPLSQTRELETPTTTFHVLECGIAARLIPFNGTTVELFYMRSKKRPDTPLLPLLLVNVLRGHSAH